MSFPPESSLQQNQFSPAPKSSSSAGTMGFDFGSGLASGFGSGFGSGRDVGFAGGGDFAVRDPRLLAGFAGSFAAGLELAFAGSLTFTTGFSVAGGLAAERDGGLLAVVA